MATVNYMFSFELIYADVNDDNVSKCNVKLLSAFFVLSSFKLLTILYDDGNLILRKRGRGVHSSKDFSLLSAHPSECTDDERPSMIGECFTFVKPDNSERSRVPRSHSCVFMLVCSTS